jgi:ABC-2 type transport system permease protein
MNKTFVIFAHEFLYTIKRTGFIILTLAFPILALLGIGVFQFASGLSRAPAETITIGFVDEAGRFNQFTNQDNISLTRFNSSEAATQALLKDEISEYIVIPMDYTSKGVINLYSLEKQVTVPTEITAAIKNFLSFNLLVGKVSDSEIRVIESPLNVIPIRLTKTGAIASEKSGLTNLIIPGIFSLLLALSLSFSSAYVLQGLGEEKEGRVIEILLSSISTRQLIIGKVIGIGTACLLQVVVWVISIPLLLKLATSSIGGFFSDVQIPANFLILGIVYFVLGYLLFAVLSASVAAVSATVREGQALASIFTIFAVAPFWFYSLLLLFPNNPIWIIFSIFPFSAPVLVMLRFGMVGISGWQLAASITVLVLSIIGGLLLAAKLLRTSLLMYGKRPTLKEIIRSLKTT